MDTGMKDLDIPIFTFSLWSLKHDSIDPQPGRILLHRLCSSDQEVLTLFLSKTGTDDDRGATALTSTACPGPAGTEGQVGFVGQACPDLSSASDADVSETDYKDEATQPLAKL